MSFGTEKLISALVNLGFTPCQNNGSSHAKYKMPQSQKCPPGLRPFIMVILKRKQFDPHSASRYISQISRLGYDKKLVSKMLNGNK
jgi:hypothetical protein